MEMERWRNGEREASGRRDCFFLMATGNSGNFLGDDVVGQGNAGSPGSGGGSPYLRRGLSFCLQGVRVEERGRLETSFRRQLATDTGNFLHGFWQSLSFDLHVGWGARLANLGVVSLENRHRSTNQRACCPDRIGASEPT